MVVEKEKVGASKTTIPAAKKGTKTTKTLPLIEVLVRPRNLDQSWAEILRMLH